MAKVASLLASRALCFTLRSRFVPVVSNQAINCFLAVSSCTLGCELHPYLGVLVISKFTLRLMIGQYKPATGSWKWFQCYPWLGKLQRWIDKVLLGPEHPLENTRVSLPMVEVRTSIFVQDLYHQLNLPSDMLIFWPASLFQQGMVIQHIVGKTHSVLVVLI